MLEERLCGLTLKEEEDEENQNRVGLPIRDIKYRGKWSLRTRVAKPKELWRKRR